MPVLPLEDHHQGYHHADGLGEGGAQGRTGGAQSHGADEQIVQGDVGHTGHGDEVHGAFGIAHSPEDGTDDVVGGDTGDADEADGQVGGGAGHGFLGGGHDGHDGAHQRQEDHHQGDGHRHEQRDGVADDGGGFLVVLGADGPPDADGGAHGQSHDHDGDHVHDLAAHRDGGGGGCALILADDEQVGHAVEQLQKIG